MEIHSYVALGDSFTEGLDDATVVGGGYRGWADRFAAAGNDMLRPGADPDALAESFDEVIRTLLQAGCPVLMFTGFDPRFPVLRLIRGKVAAYNMHLRAIADRHQCYVVDLWS